MRHSVVIAASDPLIISLVSKVLMKRDWSILLTSSKLQSITDILENDVTLFILDYELPNNSSLDLITIIRTIRPKLPILVLCEDSSLETRQELAECGVFYCALKPIQVSEIEQVVLAVEKRSLHSSEFKNIEVS